MDRHTWTRSLGVVAGYAAVLLPCTWPLLGRLGTHLVGGPGDNLIFYWNIWWFREALFELHTWPFYTQHLLYPDGLNLAFHTTTLLNTLPGAVLGLVLPLPVVYNLLIFGNFVLAAAAMHLLALKVLCRAQVQEHRHLFAGFAGLAYTLAPFHLAHLGHLNILSIWTLPMLAWSVLRLQDHLSTRRAAVVGAWLGACGLADPYHLVTGLILVPTVWFLPKPQREASAETPLWRPWTALVVTSVLVLLPVLVPVLMYGSQGMEDVRAGGANEFVADLLSYVVPSPLHPLWGDRLLPVYGRWTGNLAENLVFPTFTILVLAYWAGRQRIASASSWGFVALVFIVLSLGPFLHVGGRSAVLLDSGPIAALRIPLPKLLLDQLPFVSGARVASRFAAAGQMALVLMALHALVRLVSRRGAAEQPAEASRPVKRRGRTARGDAGSTQGAAAPALVALLCGAVVFECWVAPLPTTELVIPRAYRVLQEEIAASGNPGPLLEIPPVHRDDKIYQFYQTLHGMPLLGGRFARGPSDAYDRLHKDPFLARLFDTTPLATRDALLSLEGLDDLGVRFVMVHAEADPRARVIVRALERRYELVPSGDAANFLLRRRSRSSDEAVIKEH